MWAATRPQYKTFTQHFFTDEFHQNMNDEILNKLCQEELWRVINSWQFEAEGHIFRSYLLTRDVMVEHGETT